SRDAINYVAFLPGVDVPADFRDTTIMGLPQSAQSVTLDGINVQDNIGKTTNGFFPVIQPTVEATDALTLSLGTPGASAASHGAVQLQFVTRSGTDQFRGAFFDTFRTTGLTANSYFNAQAGLPTNTARLNEFGISEGGPISHGKAFFFAHYADTHDRTAV